MNDIKVKYWAGQINHRNMDNDGWLAIWKQESINAEKEECELLVFKVPKDNIRIIETTLQEILK